MKAAVQINTTGPFCPKCDSLIESELSKIPGVMAVRSYHTLGVTHVTIDLGATDTSALTDEIRKCGFEARTMVLRQLETR